MLPCVPLALTPRRDTTWFPVLELLAIVSVANLLPTDVGVKRAPTLAVASGWIVKVVGWPAASLNWLGLIPPMVSPVTLMGLDPVFCRVTNRGSVAVVFRVLKTSREVRPSTSSWAVTVSGPPGPGLQAAWVAPRTAITEANASMRTPRRKEGLLRTMSLFFVGFRHCEC